MRRLACFILLASLLLATRAQAQTPSITLDPNTGPPGTVITIRGRGVSPQSKVIIASSPWFEGSDCQLFHDFNTLETAADSTGKFAWSGRVEKLEPNVVGVQVGMIYAAYVEGGSSYSNTLCFRFTTGNSRSFPETGHSISDRFLQYWEGNGGLAVYGYPISEAVNETNRDTGKTYLTQWFERNRFELHPENRPPYDVLLGRLGDDRLRQQGRDWLTFPKANPSTPHYFAQTGHAIAHNPFWQYWSTHGLEFDGKPGFSEAESLALFGLPLSELQVETNASGDRVPTQWFERARFEDHGSKGVLLGLLGNEVRGQR